MHLPAKDALLCIFSLRIPIVPIACLGPKTLLERSLPRASESGMGPGRMGGCVRLHYVDGIFGYTRSFTIGKRIFRVLPMVKEAGTFFKYAPSGPGGPIRPPMGVKWALPRPMWPLGWFCMYRGYPQRQP